MSFRAAYHALRRSTPRSPGGLHRDPTPAEWQRKMDEYYRQQAAKGGKK